MNRNSWCLVDLHNPLDLCDPSTHTLSRRAWRHLMCELAQEVNSLHDTRRPTSWRLASSTHIEWIWNPGSSRIFQGSGKILTTEESMFTPRCDILLRGIMDVFLVFITKSCICRRSRVQNWSVVHCSLGWSTDQDIIQKEVKISTLWPESAYGHYQNLRKEPVGWWEIEWTRLVLVGTDLCCKQTSDACGGMGIWEHGDVCLSELLRLGSPFQTGMTPWKPGSPSRILFSSSTPWVSWGLA